jgi:hypothetical protein
VEDAAESIAAIRTTLGRLVTDGLVPYNVGENGGALLEMAVVQAARVKLDSAADEASRYEADTEALRSVLEAAVEDEDIGGKYRRLLRAVLPLTPELVGKPVRERRIVAGEVLKPGKNDVTAGTVRNYYEPKALDKLARVLWSIEQESRTGGPRRSSTRRAEDHSSAE